MPGGSLFLEAGKDGKLLFEEAESKDAVGDVFTSLLSGNTLRGGGVSNESGYLAIPYGQDRKSAASE